MKIAVPSLPVKGHINPMTTLARALNARGHDATVISTPDAEAVAAAADVPFRSIGVERFPLGAVSHVVKQIGILTGDAGLDYTFGLMGTITGAILRPLEAALREGGFEAAIFDTYQPYLELAAICVGLPYAHIANAAPFDVSGRTPLCFFDWPDDATPAARKRNAEGVARLRSLLGPSREAARAYAEEVGLAVDWDDLAATRSRRPWLTQLPRALDFEDPDPALVHAGPFVDAAARAPVPFAWERLTGAPLVYASMGTLQVGLAHVFGGIVEAMRARPLLQCVLAIGPQIDGTALPPAENVIVVPYAPQLELLRRASLCITHAGLNTALEALCEGVPLVAVPVTNDQPGVAARLRHHGVGEVVPLETFTPSRLGEAVDRVLGDPGFRARTEALRRSAGIGEGLSLAVSAIERGFAPAASILFDGASR